MEWKGNLKKVGNIFAAITYVGAEIGGISSGLAAAVEQLTRIADQVSAVDTAIINLGTQIMGHEGVGLGELLQTQEQLNEMTDQFGNVRSPPYNAIDVLLHIAKQIYISHEKVDALVDRLGNQFTNEVLAVLKQENTELDVKVREFEKCNRELVERAERYEKLYQELKEKEDGDSEGDQVEPVQES